MKKIDELTLPVALPDGSRELLRILREPDGYLAILLAHPTREVPADPGMWGIIAVDLMRHAANMLNDIGVANQTGRVSKEHILGRMKELFDKEWDRPTDEARRRPSIPKEQMS